MKSILILLFIALSLPVYSEELDNTPSPCDKKREARLEKEIKKCLSKKQSSEKVWPDLETAKSAIILALKSNDSSKLASYIGCDAEDNTQYEFLCSTPPNSISQKDINSLLNKIKKADDYLDDVKWFNYGVKKDIYILCTKKTKTASLQNYCSDKSYQPLLDIRKGPTGYYIVGVARGPYVEN